MPDCISYWVQQATGASWAPAHCLLPSGERGHLQQQLPTG